MRKYFFILPFLLSSLYGEQAQQIAYLMRSHDLNRSLELYEKYHIQRGNHDFDLLKQLATILLEEGSHTDDAEKRLLTIFGLGYAGVSSSIDIINILERGMKTNAIQTQLYCIQFIGRLQDDRTEALLTKAMSSDFLLIRLEAAYQLSMRKDRSAIGQIEALMHKLPKMFHLYFPEFFFRIGTPESLKIVRHFFNDRDPQVRIATILNAAMHGRDDLIPTLRSKACDGIDGEKEAALTALGMMKDSHSLPRLKHYALSESSHVSLAALRSLYLLGEVSARAQIIEKALQKNLFAISLLADIPDTHEPLIELIKDENIQVRLNSTLSLLRQKNSLCYPVLHEFLLRDTRDLAFQPIFSNGASFSAIKVIPSAKQQKIGEFFDLNAISLSVREQILKECLELPESLFLKLASRILTSGQTELIPLLISLLEDLQTPDAIALLKRHTQQTGSPLVRQYCNLALFRMRQEGPYEERLYDWLYSKKKNEMIQFRPLSARMPSRKESTFELTPEENSRLLIESYAALADRHDEKSINALLYCLKEGKEKNRPLIAGLLLRAIQ